MPNSTLEALVKSKGYKQFSSRRKMSIYKSLAAAISSIHSLKLCHLNISP